MYPSEITALHGRYVDLIVLGQPDPDDTQTVLFRPRPEEVVLAVGRPILVIPYAGDWQEIGRRVLVGWDASREATRAINDAMPLLAGAEAVTVLAVDPAEGPAGHGEVPGADIALHLARHGVKATIEAVVGQYGRRRGSARRSFQPLTHYHRSHAVGGHRARQRAPVTGERSRRRSPGDGRLRSFAGARAVARRGHPNRARQHDVTDPDGALRRRHYSQRHSSVSQRETSSSGSVQALTP